MNIYHGFLSVADTHCIVFNSSVTEIGYNLLNYGFLFYKYLHKNSVVNENVSYQKC